MGKELCRSCKINIAVWCRLSYSYLEEYYQQPFYCDNCVPRGCECNQIHVKDSSVSESNDNPPTAIQYFGKWKWIEPGKVWCWLDEEGREYPCCEYDYDKEGWKKETMNN